MATVSLGVGSFCCSSLEAQCRPTARPRKDVSSSGDKVHRAYLGSSKSEIRGATLRSATSVPQSQHLQAQQVGVIQAAWTRRSKGALEVTTGKKSWKQRHDKFLRPFIVDVFISHRFVHAKVVHRVTGRVVSVATTNAKDLRYSLYSLIDENACKTIGKLLAERSIEADVFAVTYSLRKGELFEGKLALVLNTLVDNGVALV